MAAMLIAAPAYSAQRGCADHWQVELNRESFAHNGAGKTFTAARLASFRTTLAATLKSVMADACRRGRVKPALSKQIHAVEVFSASGASEPQLYAAGEERLHLEWVFAEENLAVPTRMDLAAALACWTNSDRKGCAAEGD